MIDDSVTLRPLRGTDVEAFMTWAGDPVTTHPLFWDHYTDLAAARAFLIRVAEAHPWFMAVCVAGTPVGAITLDRGEDRAARRAELGYVIARPQTGKGVATAAVRLALARGFQDLDINRIEAFVDPDNVGSVRVLEKAGLIREAHLRDYVLHRREIKDRYVYAKIQR